jgi:hypothetical protein
MEKTRRIMSKLIRIVSSPFKEDEDLPWDYEPYDFCTWVWEIFLEGYKHDIERPTVDAAVGHLRSMGFVIERIDNGPVTLSPPSFY